MKKPKKQDKAKDESKREDRVRAAYQKALDLLLDPLGAGLDAGEQYELHMLLARELYSRAVNGWAVVDLMLHGFEEGAGI